MASRCRPHAAASGASSSAPPPGPTLPPPAGTAPSSSSSFSSTASPGMKMGLTAVAFRGLGCTSAAASDTYAPAAAAVRASADWQGKQPRERKGKKKRKKKERGSQGGGGDVWCAPGMPFAAEASVNCVAAHQPMVARGRPGGASERIHREVV
ncbi:hypothetical protein B296_00012709 [Ensete ventricosum]|uniref:Uncharacterized protein n=1 Tax=Ensete ventricosum TaxID=4639 RepID=A0A427B6Y4_ENSVE|nr:hypothetical protein B296_00012709 [Ensete ventricosum]